MRPVTEEPEPILFDPTPELPPAGQAMGGPAQVTEGGVIEAESHVVPQQPAQQTQQPTDPISGLIDKLGIDTETLLILGLLFLLYNEKADNALLMALAYLLLQAFRSFAAPRSPYIAASLLQRGLIELSFL